MMHFAPKCPKQVPSTKFILLARSLYRTTKEAIYLRDTSAFFARSGDGMKSGVELQKGKEPYQQFHTKSQNPENPCVSPSHNSYSLLSLAGSLPEDYLRDILMTMGERFSRDEVDDLFKEAPIKNGQFNYVEFTRILKHGAKDD